MSTTAFVPPTLGPQFVVSGKTISPFTTLTITSDEPVTSQGLIATTLFQTFTSDPAITDVGKITDPTGAGVQSGTSSFLEFNQIASVPQTTVIQRLLYTPPTLKNGQSIQVNPFPQTATSLTPGGPIDSNVANIPNSVIDVVTPPAIAGTVANQPVAANGTIKPFATTTITDKDFKATAKDIATITITDGGKATDDDGILVGPGLSKTGIGTYTIPNPVDPATLSTELQGLSFNAPNVFGTHAITFTLNAQDVPTETPPPGQDFKAELTSTDTTTSLSVVGPMKPPTTFHVVDTTKGTITDTDGDPFSGPVTGIDRQFIAPVTKDNLNISSTTPNVFIHSSEGTDAIDVSGANGTNVLDGFTGTNFLVGGTGIDQFFVDDRDATADIFSTVKNFHTGDSATVWGITQAGFKIVTGNDVLPSAPGLDFAFTSNTTGKNANLNIPGYTTADLTNGKLAVSFGRTPDMPGLPGADFMLVKAT